jgi:hypothetical protein
MRKCKKSGTARMALVRNEIHWQVAFDAVLRALIVPEPVRKGVASGAENKWRIIISRACHVNLELVKSIGFSAPIATFHEAFLYRL